MLHDKTNLDQLENVRRKEGIAWSNAATRKDTLLGTNISHPKAF